MTVLSDEQIAKLVEKSYLATRGKPTWDYELHLARSVEQAVIAECVRKLRERGDTAHLLHASEWLKAEMKK